MQANLESGKAASGALSVGRFVGILAGVPLVAILALCSPDRAIAAACGGASHPAHSASTGGGGVVAATARPPTSGGGGGGGGGGSLGCANGSSAAAPHGLPVASSGRVLDGGSVHAAHTATHARTAATSAAHTGAHLRGVRPPHA
jgi:hypothetical protein